ncbi:hypothetical protein [Actinokineospora sp.]|uniref:hypothetical protein n=1 Tax=Actinokineospora sp. TaxID=1872133 RepID=UPI004037BEA8
MDRTLDLGAWLTVEENCPMTYRVNCPDDIFFTLGQRHLGFEFAFNTKSLGRFVALATAAIADAEAWVDPEDEATYTPDAANKVA